MPVIKVGRAVRIVSGVAFPATPSEGDCFYRTDLNEFYVYDGTDWVRWEIETHASEHEPGGADEVNDIDIENTGVLLSAHAARHEDGGDDEVDVTGLSGLLADGQTPLVHEATHVDGGVDEIDSALDSRAYPMLADTLANRPVAGVAGRFFWTTDEGILYRDTGAAWVKVAVSDYPDLDDIPASFTPSAHHTSHESGGADEIKDMELNPAPADNTGSGILTVDTVGETVAAGEILYMKSDGKYWKADANAAASMPAKVMAMEAITANEAGKLLHMGYFRHNDWSWTLGDGQANLLFAHTTPGAMVQFASKPAGSGDQVQVVGYVVTADIVFFNPSYELVEIS